MKERVKTLLVSLAALLMMLGIVSQAQADLTVYFQQNQPVTISYTYNPDSATGTGIVLNNFLVDGSTISGAVLSFNFDTSGNGSLTLYNGSTLLYSALVSEGDLGLLGSGNNQVYQLKAYLNPDLTANPKYTFIWGQINVTFMPNGNYNDGGYFQVFGESKTPIPGAAWLLGTGLFGLIAIRRRKKS